MLNPACCVFILRENEQNSVEVRKLAKGPPCSVLADLHFIGTNQPKLVHPEAD
jgi:hypothetical protein